MPRSQFGAPSGVRGWVAAQLVGRLTGEANRWMVDRLDVQAGDRVLDVGCGPGHGVALAAARATGGLVAGIDASPTMVRQAQRRNRAELGTGRVEVVRAEAAQLPFPARHFGKAWTLNSLQFWPSPGVGLAEMRRVLGPGGVIVVGLMARSDDPPQLQPPGWLAGAAGLMRESGFGDVGFETRAFGGVGHWALVGAT